MFLLNLRNLNALFFQSNNDKFKISCICFLYKHIKWLIIASKQHCSQIVYPFLFHVFLSINSEKCTRSLLLPLAKNVLIIRFFSHYKLINKINFLFSLSNLSTQCRGHHDLGRMVVWFTTNYAISAYHH